MPPATGASARGCATERYARSSKRLRAICVSAAGSTPKRRSWTVRSRGPKRGALRRQNQARQRDQDHGNGRPLWSSSRHRSRICFPPRVDALGRPSSPKLPPTRCRPPSLPHRGQSLRGLGVGPIVGLRGGDGLLPDEPRDVVLDRSVAQVGVARGVGQAGARRVGHGPAGVGVGNSNRRGASRRRIRDPPLAARLWRGVGSSGGVGPGCAILAGLGGRIRANRGVRGRALSLPASILNFALKTSSCRARL